MTNRRFAVLILTHGRPDNIRTLRALKKGHYSGDVYLVIDNEDERGDEYRELYGDMVIEFSKEEAAEIVDTADARPDHMGVIYARNYAWTIAEGLGLTHFLVLDDDYNYFAHRYVNDDGKFAYKYINDLGRFFDAMNDFLDASGAFAVTIAQGGDFIGGKNSANFRRRVLRKAMNTWFLRTDRPFRFIGRINEDTNTYVQLGAVGGLFFTVCDASIEQTDTQVADGGMTTLYIDNGTFVKSFYSVIVAPSCVTVRMMGDGHSRMHHHVKWRYAVPMILSDKWRKEACNGEAETDS